MQLRPYQQRAIDDLYRWFRDGNHGNPCLVMPTGSGKSHVVAALCRDAVQSWPETQILMLTHVKELIAQNSEKMLEHWPDAPLGIYSAGMGSRQLNQITFAGIQSVRNRDNEIGHVDLCIIDECHLISHKNEGSYRHLINNLKTINPALRVVGLTATPYRLGHGLITDGGALFDAIIEPVSIEELIYKGYLSPLRSKLTQEQLDVSGVKKRGGEYIESDLQKAVDKKPVTDRVTDEVIRLAGGRKSWLFFCAGVDHAYNVRDALLERGIIAETVTGKTPKKEREQIIKQFRNGEITALTNANVLTTGFDAPDIDMIAMLRPTESPGLYVQMAGRGMRVKSHTDHCLVLDFAGVVQAHGPITAVHPPKKKGEGNGEAPVKVCEQCNELCHLSAKICPACGWAFPKREPPKQNLHHDDIMGLSAIETDIAEWQWKTHISRASGKSMLAVTYYSGNLADKPITEYFPILHEGYAGQKATRLLAEVANRANAADALHQQNLDGISYALNLGQPPERIKYKKDGKFFRVVAREWV